VVSKKVGAQIEVFLMRGIFLNASLQRGFLAVCLSLGALVWVFLLYMSPASLKRMGIFEVLVPVSSLIEISSLI